MSCCPHASPKHRSGICTPLPFHMGQWKLASPLSIHSGPSFFLCQDVGTSKWPVLDSWNLEIVKSCLILKSTDTCVFFLWTFILIYFSVTLKHKDNFGKNVKIIHFFPEILIFDYDYEGNSSSKSLLWISFLYFWIIYLNSFWIVQMATRYQL